jgi:hypothetical protein
MQQFCALSDLLPPFLLFESAYARTISRMNPAHFIEYFQGLVAHFNKKRRTPASSLHPPHGDIANGNRPKSNLTPLLTFLRGLYTFHQRTGLFLSKQ